MPPKEPTEPTETVEPTDPVEPSADTSTDTAATTVSSEIKFASSEALAKRMRSNYRSQLKKAGIEDEDGLKALQEENKAYREAKEKSRKEALSEKEKHAERIKELEAEGREKDERLTAREEALAEAEWYREIVDTSGKLGITNIRYASYLVAEAASEADLEDGEKFDEDAFLTEALLDPEQQAALMKTPRKTKKITTSPKSERGDEPPPQAAKAPLDFMKRGKDGKTRDDMDAYVGGLNRG